MLLNSVAKMLLSCFVVACFGLTSGSLVGIALNTGLQTTANFHAMILLY